MKNKITEIIPEFLPVYAVEAMENGQLFNVLLAKIASLELTLKKTEELRMNESTLLPHQERVVIEKEELAEKLNKLTAFLYSSTRTAIPEDEETRLRKQQTIMADYCNILDERISAFD